MMTDALTALQRLSVVAALLALAACAQPPLPTLPAPAPMAAGATSGSGAEPACPGTTPSLASPAGGLPLACGAEPQEPSRLLPQWHDELRLMSPDALQREIARYVDSPGGPGADGHGAAAGAMRQSLALMSNHANGDLGRALVLLDQVLRNPQPEAQPWRGWARLLQARVAEQRRLEEQLERQAQQLRDSQRRIDLLNDKLEALKAIERSLTPRPPAPAALPGGRTP
jgi:hypothetical protein